MSRIINARKESGEVTTIFVVKDDDPTYLKEILIDTEDSDKIGKVRVSSKGYVYSGKDNVAHLVLGHISNMSTVVDHVNGNRLDTRKVNLRVLDQKDNANNRHVSSNNTGKVGICERSNGAYRYYRATVSDRNHAVVSGATQSACKKYTKQFNINELGEEEAFKQAEKWLTEKRKQFGYVLTHENGSETIPEGSRE